ncbi:ubiquitin-specific protease ubp15 [Cryomyces antarcticus]|nr:ubiquitin-specific protease ubp15 [Cryomyces antarcticus]
MDQLGSDMLVDSDSAYDEKQEDVAIISPEDSNSMDDVELLPRADDFEAMFARFLPENPDLETESQVVNTWDVEGWRSLPRRTHGPTFKCAGHPWRILCFPYGNNSSESISMYLEQGFDEKPPEDWYACVQFMLVLWNPNDPTMYIRHDASHRFTGDEGDWGFTRFAEKHRIFAANFEDKGRPMVENDCAKVTAYVRVLKDPTGVLWHNFVK